MGRKIKDRNVPIGKMTRVKDFLPPPEELIASAETVKVTITLNRASVDFFKEAAQKHRAKYQRMIREVLDRYVSEYRAA